MQHPKKIRPKRRRGGRKAPLILTAVCVALAVLFVLLLPSIKRWFPAAQLIVPTRDNRSRLLAQSDAALLDTVTVRRLSGDGYTLQYADGALRLLRDGELLDLNDATADELTEAVTYLFVQDIVAQDAAEVAEHLDDMGLEPPQITVTVRYTDGREDVLEIGAGVPETTYSYYRWSGDEGIYMCDAGIEEVFSLTESRMLPISQPQLAKTLVDRVSLTRGAQSWELGFSTDAAGYTTGAIRQPYAYPMSAESADAILTSLENLRLGAAEGEVTAENRASFGFDRPVCVAEVHQSAGAHTTVDENGQLYAAQMEEQQLRFVFGRAEGDYFYTCEYEGNAYLVSRFLVDALVAGQPGEWATTTPANMEGAELAAVAVQTGMGSVDIRISKTERVLPNNQLETDAKGNLVYDTAITLNGEPMAQERFDELIQRLNAMTVSGAASEGWSYQSASPRWQMTLTTVGGTTRTIAAYAMDAFSDALAVDGVLQHYMSVEALATAMGDLWPGSSAQDEVAP